MDLGVVPPHSLLFSCSVISDSLQPRGLQHARLPCPSLSPGACPSLCPSSQWCHPTISSSLAPFFSCPQSFPASGSYPMSRLFTSGGECIGTSASVLPMNVQSWFLSRLTGFIFLVPIGLSRVFSSTTIQKHQFSDAQPSLWFNAHLYMTFGKTIALTIWIFIDKLMSLFFNTLSRFVNSFPSKKPSSCL